jgi:hypothetical protein
VLVHQLYEEQSKWALSLSISPQGDRLVEEYFDPGYKTHSVPLSRPLPEGAWVHIVMYAQVGLSTAKSWVTFDGAIVAMKTLVAAPGVSQKLGAVAGQNRSKVGAVGVVIDIDNVDITIK